jgi:hypothetical protein
MARVEASEPCERIPRGRNVDLHVFDVEEKRPRFSGFAWHCQA